MIENHRDEELCRRWDALADEDHTHRLTTQEYSLYQSEWWLHSNKQDSNTVPMRHRSDFKQAHCLPCNDCNKKQEKNHRCLLPLTNTINGRHKVLLLHGGIGKVHGGLLILPKVTMEMHQVRNERGDLLIAVFGRILLSKTFLNSSYLVIDGSFTNDGSLL